MIYQLSVAAATAVVGYDLATNTTWQRRGVHRVLRGIAMKGSAAAGDTEVEVYAAETRVGIIYNDDTGFPNMDNLKPAGNIFIRAGDPIRLNVTDAPATNPINLMLDFQEIMAGR